MKRLILIAMVVLLPSSIVLAQDFCKGDFNYNGSVGAEDVETFLQHFGRSQFNNPCPLDGPAPVPQTGQTTFYGVGDDGTYKAGLSWPNPRFTDNLDGTVTDNLTGLIWLKDANCFGTRTWNNALSDSNGLADGSCGLTDGSNAGDWRLPNLFELESLRDMSNYAPCLPSGHPFSNLLSDAYWSSTAYAEETTGHAWFVNMFQGYVDFDIKDAANYVWPVRGGHIILKGTISFKIHYPSDFVGTPEKLLIGLYPYDTLPPITTSPSFILNSNVPLGDYQFGEVAEYNEVEVSLVGVEFGDYSLSVLVFVEGSNYPIPTHGVDYQGLQNITVDSTEIVLDIPLELEFVQFF